MKKLLSLMLLFAATTAFAQTNLLEEQQQETIDVVAFFCKNDTMTYRISTYEASVNGTDTIVKQDIVEDIMIVVTDSTSKGYTLEMTSLDYAVNKLDNPFTESLVRNVRQECEDFKCIFKTDELGAVQSIVNWREIRNKMTAATKKAVEKTFSELPDIAKMMDRKAVETMLLQQYATENNIRECYDELDLLFGIHGNAYDMAVNEDDTEENGFPTHFWIAANYTPEEEEFDCEGDYAVYYKSETKLPVDDIAPLIGTLMQSMLTDEANEKIEGSLDSAIEDMKKESDNCTVTLLENWGMFYNGWSKNSVRAKLTQLGKIQKIESTQAEWLTRSWNNY